MSSPLLERLDPGATIIVDDHDALVRMMQPPELGLHFREVAAVLVDAGPVGIARISLADPELSFRCLENSGRIDHAGRHVHRWFLPVLDCPQHSARSRKCKTPPGGGVLHSWARERAQDAGDNLLSPRMSTIGS